MSATSQHVRRQPALPPVLTPLLGRARESSQLAGLLRASALRLVTLTGPGGVGKTRLALHVASLLLDDFDDEVAFVPLAAVREPELVLPAIGQAIGLFGDAHPGYAAQLADYLRDRRMLLVLDAAADVSRLLGACPHLTMLVTSQAALGLAGEQLFPLEPLATPDPHAKGTEAIIHTEAVELFVQRARAINPYLAVTDQTVATIGEICRKLDGLPLAIELAAARTSILSPEALLARLSNRLQVLGGDRRDVPDRLRTMRNAVAWSYELLRPAEQALFRRLAVFRGGFSLDAVEAVFPPLADAPDPVDVLSTLVDHSLVKATPRPSGEARFLMLETLRDYGLEQLAERGEEAAARSAHAEFLVALAEQAEPHLIGGEQGMWLERLDPEIENLRAAIDWALANGRPEIPLRIGGATWRFWSLRGRLTESRAWMERALGADDGAPSEPRAKALIGAGQICEDLRDLDAAHAHFDLARQVAEAIGSDWHASGAVHGLGMVAHDRGDYAIALDHHVRAAELARAAGNRRALASALGSLGAVSYYQGDLEAAERSWNEALREIVGLGDVSTEAIVASNLGAVAAERGDYEQAERLQQRALAIQRQLVLLRDLPYTLINLGEVHRTLGDYTLSHDCFAEAIVMLREQGAIGIEGVALHGFAELAMVQGDLAGAAERALESTRLVAEADDPLSLVENAELVAAIASRRGNHAAAAELLGAAAHLREELGSAPHPVKKREMGEIETAARQALDEQAFAAAWAAGRGIMLDVLPRRIGIVAREIIGTRQPSPVPVPQAEAPEPEAEVAHNLTPREVEVLRLLAQGKSTGEVAEALFISPRTAGTHITNILGKLGLPSRTAAVAYAMRTGIV